MRLRNKDMFIGCRGGDRGRASRTRGERIINKADMQQIRNIMGNVVIVLQY